MKDKFKSLFFLLLIIFSQIILGIVIIFLLPILTKNNEKVLLTQQPKYVRYKLENKLKNNQSWFYNCLFDSLNLMKQDQLPEKLTFNETILKKLDNNKYLLNLLIHIFDYDKKQNYCDLKTYYRVNQSKNYLELLILWSFKKNNSKIIIDNKIYYDILGINIS